MAATTRSAWPRIAVLVASLLQGVSVPVLALIIGLFAWAWPSRAVRAQVLSLKERPFVQVALRNQAHARVA